jgi:hypothetical protein
MIIGSKVEMIDAEWKDIQSQKNLENDENNSKQVITVTVPGIYMLIYAHFILCMHINMLPCIYLHAHIDCKRDHENDKNNSKQVIIMKFPGICMF